jgi:hypothetical protein
MRDASLYADAATSAVLVLLLKPAIEKTSGFRHGHGLADSGIDFSCGGSQHGSGRKKMGRVESVERPYQILRFS